MVRIDKTNPAFVGRAVGNVTETYHVSNENDTSQLIGYTTLFSTMGLYPDVETFKG